MKIIIQCGDHFENQQRIFILSKQIKEMGHTPIILMYRPGKGNIFKAHDIKVIALNNYLPKKSKENLSLDDIVLENLTIRDFLKIEIKRRPNIAWPSQIKKTTTTVHKYIIAISSILEQFTPNRIVIWNGYTGYVANILRVLAQTHGIKSAFLERGLIKDSIFMDKKGVNGAASIASIPFTTYQNKDHNTQLPSWIFKKNNTSDITQQDCNLDQLTGKTIVFFPLQVQLDTNIILYSPFNTMREAFFHIYDRLNSDNTEFVIRPHPEEDPETKINIPKLKNVTVSKDKSLDYWIDKSDLIVTINSTVGLEALINGKPVICLGRSIYSCIHTLASFDEIHPQEKIKADVKRYLNFLISNNLLAEKNNLNKKIIEAQLEIQSTSAEIKISKEKPTLIEKKKGITISIDCDINQKLDLTYRNNSAQITMEWIISILKKHVADTNEIKLGRNMPIADVRIVNEAYKINKNEKHTFIIDIYGNLLN